VKRSEAKNEVENKKSGGKVAEQRRGKGHVDYWKSRLFPRWVRTRDDEEIESPDLAIRIQHAGRREEFNLHTANAATAAAKARDIYLRIVGGGWYPALAEFKPKPQPRAMVATIGELLAAAEKVAAIRPYSLRAYSYAVRRIAADLVGLSDAKGKDHAHSTKQFREWRAKVDAISLSKITPDRVAKWRAQLIAARKGPVERERAEVTADSIIRNARALFGRKILPHIRDEVTLPDPLPFAGIQAGKTTKRFRAEVPAATLFTAAASELRDGKIPQPEVWKAFVLCLVGGLRKREADCLTWAQLRPEEARIEIRRTEHFATKTDESERDVDLSPDVCDLVRRFKEFLDPDPEFVLRGGPAKPDAPYEYYRANLAPWRTWRKLSAWLRSKGIQGTKPIHGLRKAAGSLIHEHHGIEAARSFLGHADISTTSASYVDKKPRVAVSFAPASQMGANVDNSAGVSPR
jgi:hypothetical protein